MFERTYDKLIMKLLAPTIRRMIEQQVKANSERLVKQLLVDLGGKHNLRNLDPNFLEVMIAMNTKLDLNVKSRVLDVMKPRDSLHFG